MRDYDSPQRFDYLKTLDVRIELPDYTRKSQEAFNEYRFQYDSYLIHKIMRPDLYEPTYDEANMTHRFIKRGFNPSRGFNPYENWFGVSVYEPNLIFTRGKKAVLMSLQGMSMPLPTSENTGTWELIKSRSCKYIGFKDGKNILYEDWSGNLPSQDFIENFIS